MELATAEIKEAKNLGEVLSDPLYGEEDQIRVMTEMTQNNDEELKIMREERPVPEGDLEPAVQSIDQTEDA